MKYLLILSVIILTSCNNGGQNIKKITLSTQFDAAQTKLLLNSGNNTIQGSALLRQRGGGVVTCAGNKVWLMPVTDHSIERQQYIYGSDIKAFKTFREMNNPRISFTYNPKEFFRLVKRDTCDAQGNFVFNNISDGDFFVLTNISWTSGSSLQGGELMHRVRVRGGETKKVVLSNN